MDWITSFSHLWFMTWSKKAHTALCNAAHVLSYVCITSARVLWVLWCGGESGSVRVGYAFYTPQPYELTQQLFAVPLPVQQGFLAWLPSVTILHTNDKILWNAKLCNVQNRRNIYIGPFWKKLSLQRWLLSSNKLKCLAYVTLCWCEQTRVPDPASLQHALHSVATWHGTPNCSRR